MAKIQQCLGRRETKATGETKATREMTAKILLCRGQLEETVMTARIQPFPDRKVSLARLEETELTQQLLDLADFRGETEKTQQLLDLED